MTAVAWLALIGACAAATAWWVRSSLYRLERARLAEAVRREAYQRYIAEERHRQAAGFAAETLAFDEAVIAAWVREYRMTEGDS